MRSRKTLAIVVITFIITVCAISYYLNFLSVEPKKRDEVLSLGGWSVGEDSLKLSNDKNTQRIFIQATEHSLEYSYQPIALLGTAWCETTDYVYLCKGKGVAKNSKYEFVIIRVQDSNNGKPKIIGFKKLFAAEDDLRNDWHFEQSSISGVDFKKMSSDFDNALRGSYNSTYKPIVFSRKNYRFGEGYSVLCLKNPKAKGEGTSYAIVSVCKNKSGNPEISKIENLDFDRIFMGQEFDQ